MLQNEDELKKLEAKLGSLKSKLSTDVASRSAENDKLSAQLAETMQNMLKVQVEIEITVIKLLFTKIKTTTRSLTY